MFRDFDGCRRRRLRWLSSERLETRCVLDSTVVFNELMYNPADDDGATEFIELRNQMSVDMDLSGWRLSGGVRYEFPQGTILSGKSLLVVGVDPAALEEYAGIDNVFGPWDGRLSNGGEQIELLNNNGRTMNVVTYDDGGEWPVAADGSGASLMKTDELNSDSSLPINWTFSATVGGTPGKDNQEPAIRRERHEILSAAAPATAFVPVDDSLGLSWTEISFDDRDWLHGTAGIGFDRLDSVKDLIGLDLDEPPDGQSPMPMLDVNSSFYTRIPFRLDRPADEYQQLELRMRYDDGFVAYLNGVEWVSDKAPGRNGKEGLLSWNSTSTQLGVEGRYQHSFDLLPHVNLLQEGDNLLAVHGLNRSVSDREVLIDPVIVAISAVDVERPVTIPQIALNEISVVANEAFVELANYGDTPIELDGMLLRSTASDTDYALPSQPLASEEVIVISQQQIGYPLSSGDRIFLLTNNGEMVLDGVRADDDVLGRLEIGTGDWQIPRSSTPGRPNEFGIHTDVVINEIMYHHRPDPSRAAVPASVERGELVPFDATWRYNHTGESLPANWHQSRHAVGGSWNEGVGLLGVARNVPLPGIQTELARPRDNRIITTYFETDFQFSQEQFNQIERLQLQHVIDDGAVFYLNGNEIFRFNLPEGPINSSTRTPKSVTRLSVSELIDLPIEFLVVGTNRFSVEVHQRSDRNVDMVMGARLYSARNTSEVIPSTPFAGNDEEWIELHNRGETVVNLAGWSLADAVEFEFPVDSKIDPGGYVVVARDADALRASRSSSFEIAGTYRGRLANGNERIVLLDQVGNVTDSVHYYDGGRWDSTADGNGSSLELVDPNADNSRGEAWAASDEARKSEWRAYTYRGTAAPSMPEEPTVWQEFAFGFLDGPGEMLIDDIRVVQEPGKDAIDLIQNGGFDEGTSHWRLLGNHQRSHVVQEDGNAVLRVLSSGATEYQGNQIETTLKPGAVIQNGTEYEISYRAKWKSGSRQLNSRLYFNRLARTTVIDVPAEVGTPGAQNSQFAENMGPTYDELRHFPVVPQPFESTVVSVTAEDPDEVAQMTLWYQTGDEAWQSVSMISTDQHSYVGHVPGQAAGSVVQFYVQGQDQHGASTAMPRGGRDSRALFIVDDGQNDHLETENFRLIMTPADAAELHTSTNALSNERLGATIVSLDDVFYDVGVRLKGSFVGRDALRVGFNIRFHPDQKFRGVHEKVSIDRSTHAVLGIDEILVKHIANQAGGIPGMYDDVIHFVAPREIHTGKAALRMAAFENVYLDSQFENGSDGTLYEYEVIRWTMATIDRDPESLKRAGGGGYANIDFSDYGSEKEAYRWVNLIVSNRTRDDYDSIIALNQALSFRDDRFDQATREIMDIDQWMRTAAYQALVGPGDAYFTGSNLHNFRLYVRPDGKVMYMPWDWDSAFQTGWNARPSAGQGTLRLVVRIPSNLRRYYGHMLDIIDRSFNSEYMEHWVRHYGALGRQDFAHRLTFFERRSEFIPERIEQDSPRQEFSVTVDDGSLKDGLVSVSGVAWFDVDEIRVVGTDVPLEPVWSTEMSWHAEVPVHLGADTLTFEAYDFHGDRIGSATVQVENPDSNRIFEDFRIAEVHYHPRAATPGEQAAGFQSDDFDFIELMNRGDTTLSLRDVRLVKTFSDEREQGVAFDFSTSAAKDLLPGDRVVVVEDVDAFRQRYGDSIRVAGQWSGGLSNQSETITLAVGDATIQQVRYEDAWYPQTDGAGMSLVIVDFNATLERWNVADGWSPSGTIGGSPGVATGKPGDVDLDGRFTTADLVAVFAAGEYLDDIHGNSTFAEGDWDGDGDFTTEDIVLAFVLGGFTETPPAARRMLAPQNVERVFADSSA